MKNRVVNRAVTKVRAVEKEGPPALRRSASRQKNAAQETLLHPRRRPEERKGADKTEKGGRRRMGNLD